MSAYRFCRTDDVALLVDALNRCWSPSFPDEPPMTSAAFKRSIRDLQVWCSSCMVAFSGSDPVGILIGAKRTSGTLVHKIAVHPDHRRQGHARHLLASLGSKLAIIGPPRITVEVPAALTPACELFKTSGFVHEALLTDYVLPAAADAPEAGEMASDEHAGRFVIPVTVDDLVANGLLEETRAPAWARSVETVTARKDQIAGLAVSSEERIEAYLLYREPGVEPEGHTETGPRADPPPVELVALRSSMDDGGARLRRLLGRFRQRDPRTVRFSKVHPEEFPDGLLEALGFRTAESHFLYAAKARSA